MTETAAPALPKLPMDAIAIRKILPHRYPFVLVDRVIALEPGQSITALKCVSQNEPYFQGHFPEQPIMPGVLQLEALAQTAALMALCTPALAGKLAVLTSIDNAKFRRQVVPGDVLTLQIDQFRFRRNFGKAHGAITVDGEVACECEIGFGLV